MYDVRFPHLGITIEHLRNSVNIGNFSIAFYGMIIGLGIIIGLLLTWKEARRTGQSEDLYTDFIIWGIIGGVVGARIYYVAFQWDYYKNNVAEIFNLRSGGLAIYGTIIGAFLALFIFCKIKKAKPLTMLDTMVPQLALAQAMGRWGNFFNMEAFGRYTDSFIAMQLRKAAVPSGMIDADILSHVLTINGTEYIQVIPTFLIESTWCLLLAIFLYIMQRHKKFEGNCLWLYVGLYGFERMFVEGLRTDSLMIPGTGIRVSQALAIACVIFSAIMLILGYKKASNKTIEKTPAQEDNGQEIEIEVEDQV